MGSHNGNTTAFLPKLAVVTEGLLSGFVLINPRWAGFKVDDYLNTSDQITVIPESEEVKVSADSGDFDLRGFEIVRSQMFNVPQRIRMIVANGRIKFTEHCYKKLGYPEFIELLIHPRKQLFAVRLAPSGSRDLFQWGKKNGDRYISKIINGRVFLPTLFTLFGWNPAFQYKISGSFYSKNDESVLFFDIGDTQTIIPSAAIPEEKKELLDPYSGRKGIYAYPEDWGNSFGKDYYDHEAIHPIPGMNKSAVWNISSNGVAVGEKTINPTDTDTLQNEIGKIVKEIREDERDSYSEHAPKTS